MPPEAARRPMEADGGGKTMYLHTIKNRPGTRKKAKRVGRGRGSGSGKTCGRGHKGQMSRKGSSHKEGFEGGQMRLIRRLPKRGFKSPARTDYLAVNVGALDRFDDGTEVTPALLRSAGLAKGAGAPLIKILGGGELKKKLSVKVHAYSRSAGAKIEGAGGTCEVVRD